MKKTDSYIVHEFMVKQLKLKGCELLIYAYIFNTSMAYQFYTAGIKGLMECSGCSRRNVFNALKSLVNKKYLIHDNGKYAINVDLLLELEAEK